MLFKIGVLRFDRQVLLQHPNVIAGVREFINCPSMRIDFHGFKRELTYLAANCEALPEISQGEQIPRYNLDITFGGGGAVTAIGFVG